MRRVSLLAWVAAVSVGACADPRYCDENTPCTDPAYPVCAVTWHECEAFTGDAGVDGPVAVPDGGCAVGRHRCGETCVADDDAQSCGAVCVACGGGTPACVGGTCACTASSCATGEVCAGGACVSGTCTTAADCQNPPPCRVAAGAVCNASHLCEYPLAATGATCSTGHCCAGTCVPNDPAHCGASCAPCGAVTGGSATCDGTACGYACGGGYYDSGTACAACDVPDHCGASCQSCPAVADADRTCAAACGYECHGGFYDTGATCAACAIDTHCGPSCVACAGTTPTCLGTRCGCTAASCGTGATPICDDASKACRGCVAHGECASGACDFTSGACVAAADVIYVDKGASCPGTGAAATPYCDFPPALATVTAGATRWRIVMQPGIYAYSGAQIVQDRKVMVIGAGTGATELVQNLGNTPVLQVLGTGELSLYHVVLRGASGGSGDGVLCGGIASTATLTISDATLGPNSGLGINGTKCAATVTETRLSGNVSGGLSLTNSSYTVVNCLFVKNGSSSSSVGGASLFQTPLSATALFVNNTVAENAASGGAVGGVYCFPAGPPVVNSILWGNGGSGQQSGCTVTYSDVQGGLNGTGNINADPKFVDTANNNYHLVTAAPASPCIDAGITAGAPIGDLDGNRRTTAPDLGCYEAQ
ncbi:MAG TPA: choice-of-anchor Q domain-containing protein [Polyangia bacterium]|jgi:hypothetical protein